MQLVCIDDRFTLHSIIFKGEDCINKFITWVLDKQKWSKEIIKQNFNKRLIMTSEDEEIYNNSHIFWMCKQELNIDKVRDHCRVTGKFRGAANNKCNINLKLPITFHNFQGYDGHIIFKELNNFKIGITVIPKGIDKYMSIIVNRHITFIDSLQFYNGSLDTLASNLNNEDFKHLISEFGIDRLEILKRKDTYPSLMNGLIHMKNLNIDLYLRKILLFVFKMVNAIEAMGIFLMNNINTYKMFEIHLILIISKIFIIIT